MDIHNSDTAGAALKTVLQASGINAKKKVLKESPELKKYLKYALDAKYRYGITIPKPISYSHNGTMTQEHFDFLDKLRLKQIPADANAVMLAKAFQDTLSYESATLFNQIINRTLRLGLNIKSINSVWPDFLFSFEVMLASQYAKAKHKLIYPCYSSPKIDGVRALYADGVFYSRTGHVYRGLDHIKQALDTSFGNVEVDGELIVPGLSFQKSCGLLRRAEDTPTAVYNIFDMPSISDTLSHRLFVLHRAFVTIEQRSCIQLVPHNLVDTYAEVNRLYDAYRQQGYEGSVLKNAKAKYQKKRSMDWIKLKNLQSITLRVVDTLPGKGKYTDVVGKLVAELPNGDIVKVGSGLTDYDRHFFNSKESIIGKLIEVEYHELTPDKSLREPRFKGIRDDKTEPDRTLPLSRLSKEGHTVWPSV